MTAVKKTPEKLTTSKKRVPSVTILPPKRRAKATTRNTGSGLSAAQSASKRGDSKMFARIVLGESLTGFAAVHSIRAGYSARILKAASNFFNVPDARIRTIAQVPASTANRLEKSNAKIDSSATERVYRMGTVTRMAIEIFENENSAIEWMRQPNRALGDTAPLDLMDTEPGAASVRQVLNAIATGGAA